jgi:hypothetical protein
LVNTDKTLGLVDDPPSSEEPDDDAGALQGNLAETRWYWQMERFDIATAAAGDINEPALVLSPTRISPAGNTGVLTFFCFASYPTSRSKAITPSSRFIPLSSSFVTRRQNFKDLVTADSVRHHSGDYYPITITVAAV